MDAVETAFEDAALDAEAARTRVLSLASLEEARDVTRASSSGEGDEEALEALRIRETSKSDDDSVERVSDELSSSSGSSLDDVVDRELRNQRFLRTRARARERQGGRGGGRGAARGGGGGEGGGGGRERRDSGKGKRDRFGRRAEDERVREAKTKSAAPPTARARRAGGAACAGLLSVRHGAGRAPARRGRRARRAARAAADSAATEKSPRLPAKTRGAGGARNAEGANSPYAVPSSMTMKVGANSYEVENGRVVTLATPAEAREVRKAFGMG